MPESRKRGLTGRRVRPARSKLSTEAIQRAFALLGLQSRRAEPYPGATIFARQFQRCSVLVDTETTFAAHTGS